MVLPPLHRSSALWLAWIGGLCGVIVVLLADLAPFRIPWATPGAFFLCIVESEIFFALLVWPLVVPGLLREGGRAHHLLFYVAVLLLLAMPVVLIGANISSAGMAATVRSQALVGALALLGAGVAARARRALPWYLLAVFWISAAHPFWYFLQDQLGARAPAISVYVSPFWGAAAGSPGPAWIQASLYGLAGALLLGLPGRKAAP